MRARDLQMLMCMQLILVALILRMWIISAAVWSAILITVLLAPFLGVFNIVMYGWCITLVTAVLPMEHVKKWSTAWWNIVFLEPPGWSKSTEVEDDATAMDGDARTAVPANAIIIVFNVLDIFSSPVMCPFK